MSVAAPLDGLGRLEGESMFLSGHPEHELGSYEWSEAEPVYRDALDGEGLAASVGDLAVVDGAPVRNGASVSTLAATLGAFLERTLRAIPEVEGVEIVRRERWAGETWHVWILPSRDDWRTRFEVNDVEQAIVDRFPELLFEFHTRPAAAAPEGATRDGGSGKP